MSAKSKAYKGKLSELRSGKGSQPGRKITFNGTVTNTGDCASDDTVVTMTVPDCTTFDSANAGGTQAGGIVTWNVGRLEAGATRNVVLTVQADQICTARTAIEAEGGNRPYQVSRCVCGGGVR